MPLSIRRKGAPLVTLGGVLVLWIGARLVMWESPFPAHLHAETAPVQPTGAAKHVSPNSVAQSRDQHWQRRSQNGPAPSPIVTASHSFATLPPARPMNMTGVIAMPTESSGITSKNQLPNASRAVQTSPPKSVSSPLSGTHTRMEKPRPAARRDRWSFDGWVFFRPDNKAASTAISGSVGPLPASYGASQIGGVLRYRLGSKTAHRPSLYVRATSALSGTKQMEIAIGAAARPAARVPLSLQAEARVSDVAGRREIRPAAFAVTEIPPIKLPLDMRAEVYMQGGYVGGDFATAFVDGQAELDRVVARPGSATIRVGAGVWGGAQRGAGRLDAGPSASIRFNLDKVPVLLSADYRQRIAGDAVPQSGIAFTISTGF